MASAGTFSFMLYGPDAMGRISVVVIRSQWHPRFQRTSAQQVMRWEFDQDQLREEIHTAALQVLAYQRAETERLEMEAEALKRDAERRSY